MPVSLVDLPRSVKKLILVANDAAIAVVAIWLAIVFRIGQWPNFPAQHVLPMAAFVAVLVPGVSAILGYYGFVVRYRTPRLVVRTAWVSCICVAVISLAGWYGGAGWLQALGLGVVFGLLLYPLLIISRIVARVLLGYTSTTIERIPVAIYGAGSAGRQLAGLLRSSPQYRPAFFIDDDRALQGRAVEDIGVIGPHDKAFIARLQSKGVREVFLALPSIDRNRRREILGHLQSFPLRVRSVPALAQLLTGKTRLDQLRDITVEDLLGREPVAPIPGLLEKCVRGKRVLVTGGGGSIGSELCRQMLELSPIELHVFDHSEYALYAIESELRSIAAARQASTRMEFHLGSVCDRNRIDRLFASARFDTVYHAAAYKHVPMVERNPFDGIMNNVIGTRNVAQAAIRSGAGHFVLISTDKAVRPTSVMGAAKRVAELVVQALAVEHGQTILSMVRFGNVLGSSGSIVPLFQKQIEAGGPITLTHPDVTRYFMTIPEAVQLVIQAGAMAKGGEVFVLDMGSPVRIQDLAMSMIRLSGLTVRDAANPGGDIAVELIGLRPGEKLYEELLIAGQAAGTLHPRIWCAVEESLPWSILEPRLQRIEEALPLSAEAVADQLLEELVPGFVRSAAPAGNPVAGR